MTRRGLALRLAAALLLAPPLALLLGESIFRLAHPWLTRDLRVMQLRRRMLPRTVRPDPELGYALRPDYSSDLRNGAGRLRLRHVPYPACPERGFRGSPEQAARGRADIAVVGDSMQYGVEVDQDDTVAARLEAESGRSVVNLAVTGYGTAQELLLYRACGSAFRPKLVLFFPFINDPQDNQHFERWRSEDGGRGLPFAKWCMIFGLEPRTRACRWLAGANARFTLGDVIVHRLGTRLKRAALADPALASEGVERLCRDMGELARLARGGGGRMAVVFPEQWAALGGAQSAALHRLKACAQRGRLPYLDLREGRPGPLPIGRLDGHWNERGHREAAERVAVFLRERGL